MHFLIISLYELGQFLRIVLWVFLPLFVVVLLITTYLHHRRKRRSMPVALETGELLLPEGSEESAPAEMEQPDEDNLYKGFLWMKQKFEEYREQSDERVGALKEELAQAKEKIVDLTDKLEYNMSLLMNIHKELDRSLTTESVPATTPEAASGGSGELVKE